MNDIWLENILLEFGNRMLDVANNKENPTIGELIDRPKEQILHHLDKAIKAMPERGFAVPQVGTPSHTKGTFTKLISEEELRQQLGIKESD